MIQNTFQSDDKQKQKSPKPKGPLPEKDRSKIIFFVIFVVTVLIIGQFFLFPEIVVKRLSYSEFYSILSQNRETGKIVSCELIENQVRGKLSTGIYFQVNIPPGDFELISLLRENYLLTAG